MRVGWRVKLLTRCLAGKPEAWAELWLLYEAIAAKPIRAFFWRLGASPEEADRAVLEIFETLHANDMLKLRTCRARNKDQLQAWLYRVALSEASKWLDRERRGRRRQRKIIQRALNPDRSGADELDIHNRLAECSAVMSPRDYDRLLVAAGLKPPEKPISERTRQNYIAGLMEKYKESF